MNNCECFGGLVHIVLYMIDYFLHLFSIEEFLKEKSSQASSRETQENIDLHENLYDTKIDIEALIEGGKSRERDLDEAIDSLQSGDFWRCDLDSAQQSTSINEQTPPESHHKCNHMTTTSSSSCDASRAGTSRATSAS